MDLDWDTAKKTPSQTDAAFISEVRKYVELKARIKELSEQAKECEAGILAAFCEPANHEPGEWKHIIDSTIITIKRGERWSWDSSKIEEKFGAALPDYVKRTYGCDKRRFEKLDHDAQDALRDALTIGLGVVSIDYEEVPE